MAAFLSGAGVKKPAAWTRPVRLRLEHRRGPHAP